MPRLEKYTPYYGVFAAALIFLSWTISTGAVNRVENIESRLNQAIDRDATQKRHDELQRSLRNAAKQLNRIELYRDDQNEKMDPPTRSLQNAGDTMQWIETWMSDVSALHAHAQSVREFARSLPNENSFRQDAQQTIAEAQTLHDNVYVERARFREEFSTLTAGENSFSLTHPPSNWEAISDAVHHHEETVESYLDRYLP